MQASYVFPMFIFMLMVTTFGAEEAFAVDNPGLQANLDLLHAEHAAPLIDDTNDLSTAESHFARRYHRLQRRFGFGFPIFGGGFGSPFSFWG